MADAVDVIVTLLKSDSAVRNLAGERYAPDQSPVSWKDQTHIVYEQQSDKRQRLLSGTESGLVHTRFSIYCVDRNRARSKQLANAVRAGLEVNNLTTIGGVLVQQVFIPDGERDESVPGTDGQDLPERVRTLDCVVHYRT